MMQSEEKPLIRPPATFSPYEGEKGLHQNWSDAHQKLFHEPLISRRVKNKSRVPVMYRSLRVEGIFRAAIGRECQI
jgi:hypothetical protein